MVDCHCYQHIDHDVEDLDHHQHDRRPGSCVGGGSSHSNKQSRNKSVDDARPRSDPDGAGRQRGELIAELVVLVLIGCHYRAKSVQCRTGRVIQVVDQPWDICAGHAVQEAVEHGGSQRQRAA